MAVRSGFPSWRKNCARLDAMRMYIIIRRKVKKLIPVESSGTCTRKTILRLLTWLFALPG